MNAAKRFAVRAVLGLTAALLLMGASGIARAQDVEPAPLKKYAIKLGAFLPTQNTISLGSGDVWWSAGVDYYPHFRYRPLNGDVVFSADFNWRDSGGHTYFSIPLTAKLLWPISPEGSRYTLYGGIGGGIYFINVPFSTGITEPGLKIVFGIDLTQNFFAEMNYDYVSGFTDSLGNSLRADGISAVLGYRF